MAKARRYREVKGEEMGPMVHEEKKRYLPHISFSLDDLPEAKEWEVGETYHLALEVKQVGLYDTEHKDGVEFEVVGVKVLKNDE